MVYISIWIIKLPSLNMICRAVSFLTLLTLTANSYSQFTDFVKITKIAFGSCNNQELDQSYWKVIQNNKPDVWIWLGDNIYADMIDSVSDAELYAKQKANPYYKEFSNSTQIIGIWDDHDYGLSDGGKDYVLKEESKKNYLDFLDIEDTGIINRAGIYQSHTFGKVPEQVKVILLDTRFFRDPLIKNREKNRDYLPNKSGSILGDTQWKWLENELKNSTADVNIICSGIQVIPEEHPYEKWSNFPSERSKLFNLITELKLNNVILLSGDRHIGEFSEIELPGNNVIEITSSGLTHSWKTKKAESNSHRNGNVIIDKNFGLLTFSRDNGQVNVLAQIKGMDDQVYEEMILRFSEVKR